MDIKFLPGTGSSNYAFVRIDLHINGKQHEIDFQRDTGCVLGRDLLLENLSTKFNEGIEALRRNEYEAGYKDGRGKRGRRTWFAAFLSWRQRGL